MEREPRPTELSEKEIKLFRSDFADYLASIAAQLQDTRQQRCIPKHLK